ncbi:adenylyl-sulfate kinase [Herbaspirillum sp.]|uniref:adenylyl-sulfate kinase n=1 Tax=Herbaspirillum sp. TaxID=1890675 RepID=UPI0031D1398C
MDSQTTGMVWWITGLSGAGKTTVSRLVAEGLKQAGRSVVVLDGDVLRAILGDVAGYTPEDRLRLAGIYGRLAREFAQQGHDVVCATVSMFHAARAWNREHIACYTEIYLRVPMQALSERHPQQLYTRATDAGVGHVVGFHSPPEEPQSPDLVIDNHGDMTPLAAARKILALADIT